MIAPAEPFCLPNWRDDALYDYAEKLSLREVAWEFLRRNEDFRKDWGSARLEYGIAGYDGPTTIVVSQLVSPSLARWGCLYADSPVRDVRSSLIFWSPDLCVSVLRLTAFPIGSSVAATPFILRSIPCSSTILVMPEGPQHLLFTTGGRSLQLMIDGEDIMRPVRLMTNGAHEGKLASAQIRALQCFNDLRLYGQFFHSNVQRDRLSSRFRRVLRVLDAHLSGADNQQIAEIVFSDIYSDAAWKSPDYALRDRVRKALARGMSLMREDYRKLLF